MNEDAVVEPGIGGDGLSAPAATQGRLAVNIGYDPLNDDPGDNTGEGGTPTGPRGIMVDIYDPTQPGLGDDTGPWPTLPEGVKVDVGYDPLTDDLGDNTGEGSIPGVPRGIVVNIYDPTQPGLGDDTERVPTRVLLRINISAELLRTVFG